MNIFISICTVFGIISKSYSLDLSEQFTSCPRGNNECLTVAIGKALEKLCKSGLPELKIPKLDPIEIEEFTIGTKGTAVDIVQKYENIKVVGFKDAKVSNASVDWDKKTLTFITISPKFEQVSDYDIKGRILIFPLFGNGKSVLTQYDTSVKHNIYFEEEQKGPNTFWKVKKYTVDMQPAKISFYFENLFNGNKLLSDRVHEVVNENWEILWKDSKKDYEETYSSIYYTFAKKIFNEVPINKIFKPSN